MFDREAIQRRFDGSTTRRCATPKARAEIGQATSKQEWDERDDELYQLSCEHRSLKAHLDAAS